MKIEEFCARLEAQLVSLNTADERLDQAVSSLCQAFGVKADEVAVFALDPEMELISFLRPARLKTAGVIPITYNAQVARTARERKGSINNGFASTPHTSFFEQFRISPDTPGVPIQKIMSVPLEKEGKNRGVVQVSRKGPTPDAAGKDFSDGDLAALTRICAVISRYL